MAASLRHANVDRILSAKRQWKVAAMALTHRLHELDLLTEWGYRDACVQLSQLGYRKGEPRGAIVPETSQVLVKVFKALRSQGTGPAEVAAELDISVDELNRHVFGLVPLAMQGGSSSGGGPSQTPASTGLRVLNGGRSS